MVILDEKLEIAGAFVPRDPLKTQILISSRYKLKYDCYHDSVTRLIKTSLTVKHHKVSRWENFTLMTISLTFWMIRLFI